MPISLNKNQKLFLVHVPKTAGTSLCIALNLQISSSQHVTWRDVPDGYISFAVVRDPIDRFLSSVKFAKSERTYWHDFKHHPHQDREALQDMTIPEILDDLEKPQEHRKLRHLSWHAQHTWLFDHRIQKVHLILGTTNLEQNLNTMLRSCGYPQVRLPQINKSDTIYIELTGQDRERIQALYSTDYDLLERYF